MNSPTPRKPTVNSAVDRLLASLDSVMTEEQAPASGDKQLRAKARLTQIGQVNIGLINRVENYNVYLPGE